MMEQTLQRLGESLELPIVRRRRKFCPQPIIGSKGDHACTFISPYSTEPYLSLNVVDHITAL